MSLAPYQCSSSDIPSVGLPHNTATAPQDPYFGTQFLVPLLGEPFGPQVMEIPVQPLAEEDKPRILYPGRLLAPGSGSQVSKIRWNVVRVFLSLLQDRHLLLTLPPLYQIISPGLSYLSIPSAVVRYNLTATCL